ncbi:MAG: ArsA-related P-loop ATPase [Chloroflexota bacterium]
MPKPIVLVLASQKGGVGKTALSAHLAVAAELAGAGPVVLYDTDPQQSLAEWWRDREADTPQLARGGIPELPETLARLGQAGAKLVVIDTPPALTDAIRSVMQHADFVLVPTQDGITDLKAIGRTVQLIRELDRPYAFALTFVKPGTSQATDAATALSKFGPLAGVVCHRMLFKTAFNDSRTAQEIDPKGKAAAEVGRVWDYLGKATGLIRVSRKEKQHV